MLTPSDIERHVKTLQFAGLTASQRAALDALIGALAPPKRPEGEPTVNLYGQAAWHFEAKIVANRAGLFALRDAITSALDNGKDTSIEVMASDGEGYDLHIKIAPDDFLFSDYAAPFYYEFPELNTPDGDRGKQSLTPPPVDRFYILERETYEGETLFTTPYLSIQAAAEGHFTPERVKASDVYVLRARGNILEFVAEVFDRESWHVFEGIAP